MSALPSAVYSPAEHAAFEVLTNEAAARLRERCKQYGVPELGYAPADDTILAFRLPAVEAKTEAGIILPTHGVNRDKSGEEADHAVMNVAMVVRAGCRALDWMRSHGIMLGDLVKFGRYTGQEESSRWFVPSAGTVRPDQCKDMLQLDVSYILGSFDLAERLHGANPTMKLVYAVDGDGTGLHIIKPIVKE